MLVIKGPPHSLAARDAASLEAPKESDERRQQADAEDGTGDPHPLVPPRSLVQERHAQYKSECADLRRGHAGDGGGTE